MIIIGVYAFYPVPLSNKFDKLMDMDIELSVPYMYTDEDSFVKSATEIILLTKGTKEHKEFLELMDRYTAHNSIIKTIFWNLTHSVSKTLYTCHGLGVENNRSVTSYQILFTTDCRYIYTSDSTRNWDGVYQVGYIWDNAAKELKDSIKAFIKERSDVPLNL